MRVFATSDNHIDYRDNLKWVEQLSATDYQQDILILAGDISDKINLLELCFQQFALKFKEVLFVPGNHDIWVRRSDAKDSMEKFAQLERLVSRFDSVTMDPRHYGNISIVPLFSWYDFTFGTPNEELLERWADFWACSWPNEKKEDWVTKQFLERNLNRLDIDNETIISFSHFLPRIDVMPSIIPTKHRFIYPVLGSTKLDRQIRKLGSTIHVYGHSHVNRDVTIDGVRYINNAFGYPKETRIAAKTLKCIFETS